MEDSNTSTTETTTGASSFAEAAAALEASSSASDTASETTPAPQKEGDTPAAATAQPAGETTTVEAESASTDSTPKGEPPKWRWQDILANARETSAKEAEARLKQEHEARIAEYENERRGYEVLTAALHGDARALAMVAQADPHLAARIRGQVGQASEPEQEPQPDAALQMPDGSTVPVFTAEGLRKRDAWLQKQMEAQLAQKFQPLMSTAERIAQAEHAARIEAENQQWARSVLAPVQRLPHFADFKPEILKAIQDLPPTHTGPLEEVVYATYERLLTAKLAESTKQAESHALASLQQRAVAGTSNPSSPGATTPAKFTPGAEGFKAALAHFGAGTR